MSLLLHTFAASLSLSLTLGQVEPASDAPVAPRGPDWTRHMTLEELLEVELSAPAKTPHTVRESPGVATLFPRERMDAWGWRTLDELLLSLPGYFPAQDYERRVVGFRGVHGGWNNNRLLLLVDGVPFNDNEAGTAYTWGITPLFFARSVEVVRGPGAALYGANAINGVLAINTLSGQPLVGEEGELRAQQQVRLSLGDGGTGAVEALAAMPSARVSTVVGLHTFSTRGNPYLSYDASGRRDADGRLLQHAVSDDQRGTYGFVRLTGRGELEGFGLQYHLQHWGFQMGHGWLHEIPDQTLPMDETRHLVAASWRSPERARLRQEYVLRFQRHTYDYVARLLPAGAHADYPDGVTEALRYGLNDLFARAQWGGRPVPWLDLLGGLEYGGYLYAGDRAHSANARIGDESSGEEATDGPVSLGDYMAPIRGRPVHGAAAFAQGSVPRLFGAPLSLVTGLRMDLKTLTEGVPGFHSDGRFRQLSPRLALVWNPHEVLTVRGQVGRAFRTPVPLELFATNTWTAGANPAALRPERLSTVELGADLRPASSLLLRLNAYANESEGLTGWGIDGRTHNLFTQRHTGVELEVSADRRLGRAGELEGFASYSHVWLLSEEVHDPSLGEPLGYLTWAPADSARLGVRWSLGALSLATTTALQGEVLRRPTDRLDAENASLRPEAVPAWVRADVYARYRLGSGASAGLKVTNLLDTRDHLVRGEDLPFDYRMPGRRILGTFELHL